MTANGTLMIALLNVQSSYRLDVEQPRGSIPDTVQFWFTSESDWRIRTFAVDHDIHVHHIRGSGAARSFDVEQAMGSTTRNYGDVLERMLVLDVPNAADTHAFTEILRANGLAGSLEVSKDGVAFYNPDGGRYHTQSCPESGAVSWSPKAEP